MKTVGKIIQVKAVKGQGAYYYEDLAALQKSSTHENDRWRAPATSEGFRWIREVAEVVCLGIQTEDGQWHWGDCVGVSYSGKSGREKVFRANEGIEQIEKTLKPRLKGKVLVSFRKLMEEIDVLSIHGAIKYGISQALLKAVAHSMCEPVWKTIQREWGITDKVVSVPIQGSSGNNRKVNADKMIVNQLSALPHGQIDDISSQLGWNGEILLDYVRWLKERVIALGEKDYSPVIHLDVHGAIGKIFENSPEKVSQYLCAIETILAPLSVRMESVVLGESREETISLLKSLKNELKQRNSQVQICVDEWANTLDDVVEFTKHPVADMVHLKMPDLGGVNQTIDAALVLKKNHIQVLLGGSCIETDLSARLSVQVALAVQPTAILAKPGMGIDEGLQIMRNEMARALALQ